MKQSSVKKNIIYQVTYQILILVIPFLTSPYIARVIGAEGLGIYSYSYTVANYFLLFAMLGIANYGNRLIARCRNDQQKLNTAFTSLVVLHAMLSFVMVILYFGYALSQEDNRAIALVQTIHVLSALFDISWFYFGMEKFKLTVIRSTVVRIVTCVLVFVLIQTKNDLTMYCILMSSSTLVSQLLLWVPLHKYVKFQKVCWNEVLTHLKPMSVLFLPTIAVSLYRYMDKIMIGSLSDIIQLGLYENAEKLISVPLSVIQSFGIVLMPRMSNLFGEKNEKTAEKLMSTSTKYIMFFALGLSMGTAGIARVFAPVFWGEEFYDAGNLIVGLSISIPFFTFANIIRTQYLIPSGKDKEYTFSVFIGAFVNLIINAVLISRFGSTGAMIGTVAAEVTVCLVQTWIVKDILPIKYYMKTIAPSLIFATVMFVIANGIGAIMKVSIMTLIVQITVCSAVYVIMSLIYFYYTKDELLKSVIQRFRQRD